MSPSQQRDRIEEDCARLGLTLLRCVEELDTSGGASLDQRHGLRQAIETIEAGHAEVVTTGYFDRLTRSLRVQGEVLERVEAAGGQVRTVDVGNVSAATASDWLTGTIHGAMAEYVRRAAKERSAAAQSRAVARGVAPWPRIPPGYERGTDGVLVVNKREATAVRHAFEMRAEGATIKDVREHLRQAGIERTQHGVGALLASRVVLGEIRHGELHNPTAHPPIVKAELWQAVQRIKVTRGRKPKSDRLLARQGVLRCATCGSRLVVGSANHGRYPLYRCPPNGDCKQRVTISATLVETIVVDAVKDALRDEEGRASMHATHREAEVALERAQAQLEAQCASSTASATRRLRARGCSSFGGLVIMLATISIS